MPPPPCLEAPSPALHGAGIDLRSILVPGGRRRTGRYSKQERERIKVEGAAEEARLRIHRAFYPCSREMHVPPGEMYVADPRFAACYQKRREGLARWFRAAIKANAARAEPGPG